MINSKPICIIGDGMVGLLAAIALSKAGFDVSLVEKNPPALSENADLRVSSLTPVSVKILQSLNIWKKISEHKLSPFFQIKVSQDKSDQTLIFDGKEINQNPLGYIVENAFIRKILWDEYQEIKKTKDFNFNNARSPLSALIIAADGAESETRKSAGIACETKDYQQNALTAIIQLSHSHGKIARQRFLPEGPLAFLPLSDERRCSIVWSNSRDKSHALLSLSDAEFNAELQKTCAKGFNELGSLSVVSPRLIFPLKMQYAKQYVQTNLALIGDAAHIIHPLAGYGVNMGFLDAVLLAKILKQARESGRDIGGLAVLRKYERSRKVENLSMLKIVDSFTQNALRTTGINLAQKSGLLQKVFMRIMSRFGETHIT